jgi:hypothetical protein
VVLTPRRWCQVGEKLFRRRRWQESPVTGESAKEAVKTIARGKPGCSGELVVTTSCAFYFCTRDCGCIAHPAFPAPLLCKARTNLHRSGVFTSREGVVASANGEDSASSLRTQGPITAGASGLGEVIKQRLSAPTLVLMGSYFRSNDSGELRASRCSRLHESHRTKSPEELQNEDQRGSEIGYRQFPFSTYVASVMRL